MTPFWRGFICPFLLIAAWFAALCTGFGLDMVTKRVFGWPSDFKGTLGQAVFVMGGMLMTFAIIDWGSRK